MLLGGRGIADGAIFACVLRMCEEGESYNGALEVRFEG